MHRHGSRNFSAITVVFLLGSSVLPLALHSRTVFVVARLLVAVFLWLFVTFIASRGIKIMAKEICIDDVTNKSDDWRVKVLVAEKSNVYTNKGGKRLQKLLLLDSKGNKVEGVIWNNNINILEGNLLPYSTYIVGGAKVHPITPGFQYATPGITTQWVLSRATFVRQISDETEKIPYPPIQLTPFENIRSLANTGALIDIVAAVTNVKEPRLIDVKGKLTPIQECTVVQNELKPLVLTLWGDFVEHQGSKLSAIKNDMPIILCKGLRPTSFSGLSLSTIPFSFVSIDPRIPAVANFREWLDSHLDDVAKIANKPARNYLETAVKSHKTLQLTQLSQIIADSQAVHSTVTMSIVDIHQKVTYTKCPKCNQTQKVLPNETFSCHTCKENQIATPHSKVIVQLTDQSHTITATLFDAIADRLLDRTPEQIHIMDTQALATHLEQINNKLRDNQIIAQIKANQNKFSDRVTRYTIQEWVEKNPVQMAQPLSIEAGETDANQEPKTISADKGTTEGQTSTPTPGTNTESSPIKRTKIGSSTNNSPTLDTTSSPMKKLKLKSPETN